MEKPDYTIAFPVVVTFRLLSATLVRVALTFAVTVKSRLLGSDFLRNTCLAL